MNLDLNLLKIKFPKFSPEYILEKTEDLAKIIDLIFWRKQKTLQK
jgi:hypothetical protein